ncbi:MAG: DUF6473 family protein [Gemmobacter sp.]|nr:DUF6473 family protein [Gemmobacter sp.]
MAYAFRSEGAWTYVPCHYGKSRLPVRGPRRSLERPYGVVLGGTETFGKFVSVPFAAGLEARTGLRMVNLGVVNAGFDAYLGDSTVLEIAARAEICVVQVMGAQNLTNRYYQVHPRRNDRLIRVQPLLRTQFCEVDFTEFNFTRHLLQGLQQVSLRRFERVAEELRAVWLRRMGELLAALPKRRVLLWFADHAPPPATVSAASDLTADPLLVDRGMIEAVRPLVSDYLEVLTEAAEPEGRGLDPLDLPVARCLPGPAAHRRAADAIAGLLSRH